MFFPYIKDIAIKDVIKISIDHTIGEAIDKMIHGGHRNIVIEDGHFFHILLAKDILTLEYSDLDLKQPISHAELHRLPQVHEDDNLLESLHFLQEPIEYIASVNNDGDLVGLVSHTDIINSTDPEILMENYCIGEIVKNQRSDIWVKPDEPINLVMAKMKTQNKDCAIIIADNIPTGIFTIKDVLALYRDKGDISQPISAFMTKNIECCEANISIRKAIEFIKERHFKRLVVVDSNRHIVGMILQKEIISIAYNNWTLIMKQHQAELKEINSLLSTQAERYKKLAAIDPLTELYNRHRFIELYTTECIAMKKRNHPMSLIMLDIDFFKKINDNYGHNTGDDVLRKVSKIIQTPIRHIDIICRWGGEEFVILLPTADKNQALSLAEKLRHLVEQTEMPSGIKVTASLGVTTIKNHDTLESSISRADQALYAAKRQGRNRSVLFTEQ